jgi:phosphatidylserine/phosphatidylglycerophosphate/cardiolipin synthase-like enzyme
MLDVPDLKVQLFVHVGRESGDTRHDSEILREYATSLAAEWPGLRRPALYYDPRSLDLDFDRRATWHAKVVVIDDETSLVTSANFTEWAHQRNVEAGALIRSSDFARQLRQQFQASVLSRQSSKCQVSGRERQTRRRRCRREAVVRRCNRCGPTGLYLVLFRPGSGPSARMVCRAAT